MFSVDISSKIFNGAAGSIPTVFAFAAPCRYKVASLNKTMRHTQKSRSPLGSGGKCKEHKFSLRASIRDDFSHTELK